MTIDASVRIALFRLQLRVYCQPLTHLGELLESPPLLPARGPPADWGELMQVHDDRNVFPASPDELPVIDIHSL